MAQKTRRSKATTIVPIAGQRVTSDLKNGFKNYWIRLVARATVQVAVAPATALRNRGSVFAMFDEIGIDENGTDRHLYDGRMLRFISEVHAPSALDSVRAQVAIGTYNLEEQATLFFSHPLAAAPEETSYREIDARQKLQVFAKLNATPSARIFNVGGATVTISNISIDVKQVFDDRSPTVPLFIPVARQMLFEVSGTNPLATEYIKTSRFTRGIAIMQDTDTDGEVSDIINALALRGDNRDIIGPQQISFRDLVLDQEAIYGGAVTQQGGYLFLNFQENGKLSNIINPADDVNLRFEFDWKVSAGAGTSRVRVALLELERTAGLVAKELPFPV